MNPPIQLFVSQSTENDFSEASNSRFQAIWNKKLYTGGYYHPKDVVFGSFKIFLILRKSRTNESKTATAGDDRVCQIKTADIEFWLKSLETHLAYKLQSKLTPIFEVQGLQLRDNCLVHSGHIPMQVLVNRGTNQTRRSFSDFRPSPSLGEIARHNMRDLEELYDICQRKRRKSIRQPYLINPRLGGYKSTPFTSQLFNQLRLAQYDLTKAECPWDLEQAICELLIAFLYQTGPVQNKLVLLV